MNLLTYPETASFEDIYKYYSRLPRPIKKALLFSLYILHKATDKFHLHSKTSTYYMTWRCNARCKHCFVWKNLNKNSEELTLKEIEQIFNRMDWKISRLAYGGGEPFLREDIVEISKVIDKSNRVKKIWCGTNGIESELILDTTQRIVSNIKIPFVITVAIEGLEQTHDEVVGVKNAFQKAVKTVKLLKPLKDRYKNFQVRVLTTIFTKNLSEIENLLDFIQRELKVFPLFNFVWGSKITCFSPTSEVITELTPAYEEYKLPPIEILSELNDKINEKMGLDSLLSRIEAMRRNYILKVMKNKKREFPCQAALGNNFIIFPNGDVSYCEFTKTIGNLKDFDYSLPLLFKSTNARNIQFQLKECICNLPYILTSSMIEDFNMLKEILL